MFIFICNYLNYIYGKFQSSETSEKKVIKKVYDLLGQPPYLRLYIAWILGLTFPGIKQHRPKSMYFIYDMPSSDSRVSMADKMSTCRAKG